MKVLLVHNRYQQRGGEESVFEMERDLLLSKGIAVETYEVSNDGIASAASRIRTFLTVSANPREVKRVVSRAIGGSFDVVHVHNFFPVLSPAVHIGLAREGFPVVQTLHNYRLLCANAMLMREDRICELCLNGSKAHGLLHRCYRGSAGGSLAVIAMQSASIGSRNWIQSISRFIALTRFAKSKFITAGIPANKLVVKPNAIADPGKADPSFRRDGALFVGRIAPGKGIPTLLKAWWRIPHIKLTVIGDGPDLEHARASAPPGVEFTGALPREKVIERMKQSAFLVMPSTWYEGFPVTLVEALACGLPVIASQIGGLPELINEGESGFLTAAGDADALAKTVALAFAEPGRWPEWSSAARHRYEQLFSGHRNTDQLIGIYTDAIASMGAGSRSKHA